MVDGLGPYSHRRHRFLTSRERETPSSGEPKRQHQAGEKEQTSAAECRDLRCPEKPSVEANLGQAVGAARVEARNLERIRPGVQGSSSSTRARGCAAKIPAATGTASAVPTATTATVGGGTAAPEAAVSEPTDPAGAAIAQRNCSRLGRPQTAITVEAGATASAAFTGSGAAVAGPTAQAAGLTDDLRVLISSSAFAAVASAASTGCACRWCRCPGHTPIPTNRSVTSPPSTTASGNHQRR